MRFYSLLLALFPLTAMAAYKGRCTGPPDGKATDTFLEFGICDYTSDCNDRGGKHIANGCPFDGDSITCCVIGAGPDAAVNPCGGSSVCQWKSGLHARPCASPSRWVPNHCPGDSNFECCLIAS